MLQLSRRSYYVVGGLFLILILAWVVAYIVFLSPTGMRARDRADFTRAQGDKSVSYTALDGTPVDLDTYRDGVLVVNIWASWSPFTAADHQVLSELKKKYGETITILAVNRMESKETAEAYLSTVGKSEGIEYIMDGSDHFFTSLGGYAMPETIVFDAVGNIVLHKRGTISSNELGAVIESELAE